MRLPLYFIVFLLSLQCHAQWNKVDSVTSGNNNSINFINADTGFVYNQPGVIRRTANGGQSWDSIPLNFTGYINDMSFANSSVGYAVGGAYFPHGVHYPYIIYKTMDGGLSWDSVHAGSSGGIFTHVATVSPNEFFATCQEGMLHSNDGGQTYDTASVTNMHWGTEQYTRIRFLNAIEGYVLSRSNFFTGHLFKLYKTIDGGKNWQSIHTDSALNFSLDFVMTASGNGLIVGNDSYVLRTTNGGNSWDTLPLPQPYFLYQVEEVSGFLYALGTDVSDTTNCLFYSSDWGSTWQKEYCVKSSAGGIVDFSIPTEEVGYLTTWREIFKNDHLISLPEPARSSFELYPNPANDEVFIKLAEEGDAKVWIYNMQGQEVAVASFVNPHILNLDITDLKRGMYILKVQQVSSVALKFLKN